MKKHKLAITMLSVLLMLLSLPLSAADTRVNLNPEAGTTSVYAPYVGVSNNAYAYATSKYGDPLNESYAWVNYLMNDAGRTGFNPGPAPDRPDILWKSVDIWPKYNMTPLNSAFVAFSGKLFQPVTKPLANGTLRPHLAAFDPHTGVPIWWTPLPAGYTFSTFAGANRLHKVDDNHLIALLSPGAAMFRVSDGKLLWIDPTINPGASYHSWIVIQERKIAIGPVSNVSLNDYGFSRYLETCWDLSNPEIDKGPGGRVLWQIVRPSSGTTQMAYGDGLLYEGSFVSCTVWAINVTNGEIVWQTKREDAAGYAGAYSDGRLIVACQSKQVICYNGTTGDIIWKNSEGLANRAFNVWSINIAYGRVYVHDLGAGITGATRCLSLETGEELWRARTDMTIGYYQNAIADGKLYGRQSDSSTTTGREPIPVRFSCWDAFTGKEIWSLQFAFAWPTVAYGCLYVNAEGITYAFSTAVKPKDWSMWRGNVEMPGVTDSYGPRNLFEGPKWTFTTGGPITSSPVIANGKLYINSGDRNVYCLDAYTGKLIWNFTTAQPLMWDFSSTPAVVGNKVIIGPDDGYIYCLDANTGKLIWKVDAGPFKVFTVSTQFNVRSSPIIYNDRIYVSSCHNNLTYCIDLNGRVIWAFKTKTPVFGSVAIENNYIYFLESAGSTKIVSDSEGYVGTCHKLDMSGNEVLSFPVRCDFYADTYSTPLPSWQTPVVVGDRVYIGVNNRRALCYNGTNGKLIFATELRYILAERSHGSATYVPDTYLVTRNATSGQTFATTGGKVFCNGGPTMACFRGDNGSALWQAWGGWEIFGSPTFSGMRHSALLYCGSESYGMTVWNASTGTPISWYTTRGGLVSSPAVWDGKLYFGSQDNKVYCFEDHPVQEMSISMSLDKMQVNVSRNEPITITIKLTGVTNPDFQLNEAMERSAYKGSPPLPNAKVIVTFTDPDGKDVNVTATTDNMGNAVVTYTPNKPGQWKVIAWYEGEHKPTYSYGYAFSDQVVIEALGTTGGEQPPPPPPSGPTTPTIPTEWIIAAVAVIVIMAIAAILLLKRRKK